MDFESTVKWWQSQTLNTREDYQTVLENFQIIFTCNSNNIEGDSLTYHTTREIYEEAPISASGVLPRQIFEVRNQKFAFNFLIDALINKEQLSIEFIKKLHKIMMYGSYDERRWRKGERPGEFKVNDYCVGMTEEGTPPQYVEEDLSGLLDEVNGSNGNVMITATYFHASFETIHPFADGNGRIGRTLLNYYLMLRGYPPMVIHNEDKDTYFLGLEVFDRVGELSGLVKFFQEQIVKTWGKRTSGFTQEEIRRARTLAPTVYQDLSDEELWDLIGPYVKSLSS